jgi:DNA-binding NtrC family response regulator
MNPQQQPPILLVDPDDAQRQLAERALVELGVGPVATLRDRSQVRNFLARNRCVLVMLNVSDNSSDAAELVGHIVCENPAVSVVVTGANDVHDAVACIRNGASDYLPKPLAPEALIASARRALGLHRSRVEEEPRGGYTTEIPAAFAGMVTASPTMLAIFQYLGSVARSGQPLLITGETGTGKELLARAVHALSQRRGQYAALDVGTLDEAHFTEALLGRGDGRGLVAQAAGGTLFIDQVDRLSPSAQSRLLRLLQDQELAVPTEPRRLGFRLIAASTRDLRQLREGLLREDLFYRLRTHHAAVPPLRTRREDVPLLLDHFVGLASSELGRERPQVPSGILELLANYAFPGNVRELRSLVFDAVSRSSVGQLSLTPFAAAVEDASAAPTHLAARRQLASLAQLPTLKEIQTMLVEEALRRTNQHQSSAAALLGVTRQALNKRLRGRGRKRDAGGGTAG